MMSLIWGWNGRRLKKVRLRVKRGLLLQTASTSEKAARRAPDGVSPTRAARSLSACQAAASRRPFRRVKRGFESSAGVFASGSSGVAGSAGRRLHQ